MENNGNMIPKLNKETIKSMIYTIRGQKVMLDSDLAEIYGYSTKAFNQQVQRNIEKFPDDFMFQVTYEELSIASRSQIVTMNKSGNLRGFNVKYLPKAFTEQGIYMLMTVLKGELATNQSLALVRTFKQLKDYIADNKELMSLDAALINNKFESYDRRFEKIENKLDVVMDNFIDPSTYKHYLILDGQKIEADIAYQDIYKKAKNSIYLIDDYVDIKTLQLLKSAKDNINIVIFTDNKAKNGINDSIIKDSGLNITIKDNKRCHDRYIIVDYKTKNEIIYHSGASLKDAGNKVTTIMQIEQTELYHKLIDELLNK